MSNPSENDIYNRIAAILKEITPSNSTRTVCTAEISVNNDHAKISYDYIDNSGVEDWFIPATASVDSELLDLFVELKKFSSKTTTAQPKIPGQAAQWSSILEVAILNYQSSIKSRSHLTMRSNRSLRSLGPVEAGPLA